MHHRRSSSLTRKPGVLAALLFGAVACNPAREAGSDPPARTEERGGEQSVSPAPDREVPPDPRYSGVTAEGVKCLDLAQYRAPGVIWPRTTWADELTSICNPQRIDDPILVASCNGSRVVYERSAAAGRRLHYDATTGKLVGIYEYDPVGRRCFGAPAPIAGCPQETCRDFRPVLCEGGGSCLADAPRGT